MAANWFELKFKQDTIERVDGGLYCRINPGLFIFFILFSGQICVRFVYGKAGKTSLEL